MDMARTLDSGVRPLDKAKPRPKPRVCLMAKVQRTMLLPKKRQSDTSQNISSSKKRLRYGGAFFIQAPAQTIERD